MTQSYYVSYSRHNSHSRSLVDVDIAIVCVALVDAYRRSDRTSSFRCQRPAIVVQPRSNGTDQRRHREGCIQQISADRVEIELNQRFQCLHFVTDKINTALNSHAFCFRSISVSFTAKI